jgi:2-C-methyl-D-erythritol 4-phosphate cytidylyltransferase
VDDVWGIVVAGGAGNRFGSPKQFAMLAGRPVVAWSVAAAREALGHVVVVLPSGRTGDSFGADVVVVGGPSRSASVRNGLAAVPAEARVIVVHDAARPLAAPDLFRAVVRALQMPGVGGAICAVPVNDTLKRVDRPLVASGADVSALETLDRDTLVSVQTPQAFDADVLRRAHAAAGEAPDDAALVEATGATVRVVPGDPRNLKVTSPSDLALVQHLLGS